MSIMAKTKGRRRRKNSRQEEDGDDDCCYPTFDNGNKKNETGSAEEHGDANAATRSPRKNSNNKTDLSFAERRELQRKNAAEKRRQKMKVSGCQLIQYQIQRQINKPKKHIRTLSL